MYKIFKTAVILGIFWFLSTYSISNAMMQGTVGTSYNSFSQVSGGMPWGGYVVVWWITPPWLTFNSMDASFAGVPTTAGVYNFTVDDPWCNWWCSPMADSITIVSWWPPPVCSTPVPSWGNYGSLTYNPSSLNQSWTYGASSCGYTCINGYTGNGCATPPAINGACWTAAKTYLDTATAITGTLCWTGTASPSNPTFPGQGGITNYSCVGENNGTTTSCSIRRSWVALVNNIIPVSFKWVTAYSKDTAWTFTGFTNSVLPQYISYGASCPSSVPAVSDYQNAVFNSRATQGPRYNYRHSNYCNWFIQDTTPIMEWYYSSVQSFWQSNQLYPVYINGTYLYNKTTTNGEYLGNSFMRGNEIISVGASFVLKSITDEWLVTFTGSTTVPFPPGFVAPWEQTYPIYVPWTGWYYFGTDNNAHLLSDDLLSVTIVSVGSNKVPSYYSGQNIYFTTKDLGLTVSYAGELFIRTVPSTAVLETAAEIFNISNRNTNLLNYSTLTNSMNNFSKNTYSNETLITSVSDFSTAWEWWSPQVPISIISPGGDAFVISAGMDWARIPHAKLYKSNHDGTKTFITNLPSTANTSNYWESDYYSIDFYSEIDGIMVVSHTVWYIDMMCWSNCVPAIMSSEKIIVNTLLGTTSSFSNTLAVNKLGTETFAKDGGGYFFQWANGKAYLSSIPTTDIALSALFIEDGSLIINQSLADGTKTIYKYISSQNSTTIVYSSNVTSAVYVWRYNKVIVLRDSHVYVRDVATSTDTYTNMLFNTGASIYSNNIVSWDYVFPDGRQAIGIVSGKDIYGNGGNYYAVGVGLLSSDTNSSIFSIGLIVNEGLVTSNSWVITNLVAPVVQNNVGNWYAGIKEFDRSFLNYASVNTTANTVPSQYIFSGVTTVDVVDSEKSHSNVQTLLSWARGWIMHIGKYFFKSNQ